MPRTNYSVAPLPSAARTATAASPVMPNRRHTGVVVMLNISAASGTGGLTLKIRGLDPVSGNFFDLLSDGAPITATGLYVFSLNPSEGAASAGVRVAVSRHLPQEWQVQVVAGDGSSYTYSVSATLFV